MTGGAAGRIARHRRVVLAALPPAIAALALLAPGPGWQVAALAPFVAVFGVPHGALDHRLAGLLWPLSGLRAHLGFLSGYVALAGAVLALWLALPAVALALFLTYSALHFSDDWRGELSGAARALAGLAVVAAPATAHEAEVAAIFAHLAPAAGAERAAAALAWAGMAAVPLLAVALAREARGRPGLAAELALIPAAAFLLPPLVHFLVYFCAVHSPRHFLSASAALGLGPGGGALAALPITLATLVGAGALAAALLAAGVPADAVALRAVFIGLAALTVPHMLLVDRVWRRAGAASP